MIKSITVTNFKSIQNVTLRLGRLTVLIGENGAGKSNILEAFAIAGAAEAGKLDNEFLTSRGIRVSSPKFMSSAFNDEASAQPISISIEDDSQHVARYEIVNKGDNYANWESAVHISSETAESVIPFDNFIRLLIDFAKSPEVGAADLEAVKSSMTAALEKAFPDIKSEGKTRRKKGNVTFSFESPIINRLMKKELLRAGSGIPELESFVIFSPENSALRTFSREGQIEPLGVNGEGLLKLLSVMANESNGEELARINNHLRLLGWFKGFQIADDPINGPGSMSVFDVYVSNGEVGLDQRSVNEGFLFLLFYFALFSSRRTPRIFAIDNIDASLNPKLCEALIRALLVLANDHDKQVILTTHNPAVLDGLNLDDPSQRLFVVSRGRNGETRARAIKKPTTDGPPVRLSEAFLRGVLGGLPKTF